jgi:glycerol-3-phosphate acyltransferase PlsY
LKSSLRRRLFHMLAGLSIVMAMCFLPKMTLLLSLWSVTFLFLVFEFIRLRVSGINWWFISLFGSMLREEETTGVTTSSYVLVAALVSYMAFGRDIAILSVSFLAIGDVAAAIVGQHIGRTRLFGKALEGDLACFFSCLAIGFVLYYAGLHVGSRTIVIGAVGATVGQAIQMPVDDNLTLPLFAGVLMAAVPG